MSEVSTWWTLLAEGLWTGPDGVEEANIVLPNQLSEDQLEVIRKSLISI